MSSEGSAPTAFAPRSASPFGVVPASDSAETLVEPYRGEREEWDGFVRRSAGATPFHLIGWKHAVERAFSLRSHYLVARRGAEIVGVLPIFELHAPFLERRLLSLPFAVEAGVCAADDDARRALDAAALARARQCGARCLELRDGLEGPGFRIHEGLYYRFRRPLHESDEENFAAIPSKRRNRIRFAQRHGLVARAGRENLDVFHDLYAHTARHHGTPLFPRRFFGALLEELPGDSALLVVWLGDVPAAAALLLFFADAVCPYYVGARRDLFPYATTDFLFWECMRHATRHGARLFDFGRSKRGTGAYDFKRRWGFEPEPLRYRVHAVDGADVAQRSAGAANLRLVQRAWRRLPLPLTKLLGPFVLGRWGAYYT